MTSTRAGIGLMCLGILLFSLNDVMGKWLMATYSVGQVLLVRSLAAVLLLLPFMVKLGWRGLIDVQRPGLQLARVAFGTLEVAAFYYAVTALSLVNVMTYYLAAPLYVAVAAPFLLKERLSVSQIAAALAGFGGVLMVLRPSAETLTLHAVIAITGSLLFAGLILSTRQLRGTSATALIVWQTMGALVFGLVFAPFHWVQPGLRDFAMLSLLGVVSMLAHVMVTRSLAIAPASVVSPFQYTLLLWAVLFGWLIFGDWPDIWMLAGSAVIVASGLSLLWHETGERGTRANSP